MIFFQCTKLRQPTGQRQLLENKQILRNILKIRHISNSFSDLITVKDGGKTTQNVLVEHKVITTEQQFLGVILSIFMHLRWP